MADRVRRAVAVLACLAGTAAGPRFAAAETPRASAETADDPDVAAETKPPALYLRGFADMRYSAEEGDDVEGRKHGFAVGEFDLFVTSNLSPDLRVLSEVVFHFEEGREEEFLEVERLLLQYQPADAFGVRLGRLHTSIGEWNNRFHHGTWLQTTIDRPDIFAFEDEGGILPIHSVGVELFGLRVLGGLELHYSAGVFNGRGRNLRDIQTGGDLNRSKAINLRLELLPTIVTGLRLGASYYGDTFPADASIPDRESEVDERILSAHLVYESAGTEVLAELIHQRHEPRDSGRRHESTGGYVQAAQRFGRWKPYARVDVVEIDETSPVLTDVRPDVNRLTLGLRWDPGPWLAVKAELRSTREGERERLGAFVVQAAFTF